MTFLIKNVLVSAVFITAATRGQYSEKLPSDQTDGSRIRKASWGYKNLSSSHGGGYLGPDFWSSLPDGGACNGTRQSPVNFETSKAIKRWNKYDPLFFDNYTKAPIHNTWTFINNGHSVQINATYRLEQRPALRQLVSLSETYIFDSLHFHWGSDDDFGSEHTIDGKPATLELHLVHRLLNATREEIIRRPDGLAVIGIMFELSERDNPKIDSFVKNLQRVAEPGSRVDDVILADNTIDNFLPSNKTFFRYLGSLTTPPCTENVVWTVFTTRKQLSSAQLAIFRNVLANNELLEIGVVTPAVPGEPLGMKRNESMFVSDNYRPVQPLHGRSVILYVDGGTVLSHARKGVVLFSFLVQIAYSV